LVEGYNSDGAKVIKRAMNGIPLLLVGGMRTVSRMEALISGGIADFISMSRPFIGEPHLVKRIKEKKADKVSCVSYNKCLAAVPNSLPVQCYN
jgi:2,4-dienoyl-CoA reductase-like NADH-dependent reductase (Old Yellow Enzyme family)